MVKRSILLLMFATVAAPISVLASDRATTHDVVSVGNRYVPGDAQNVDTPAQVIFQGDSLEHTNLDADLHDLVSIDFGPNGQPWFDSALISQNETAPVPVENLKPGVYSYTCSIHPFMRGRLEVKPPLTPQPEPAEETLVVSGDSFFSPRDVTIPVGTTVRWRNDGQMNHTVTASDGSWDSSPACPQTTACWGPGQTFTRKFDTPGLVRYYCKLHGTPSGSGHAGTVNVVDPSTAPTSVTSMSASPAGGSVSVTGAVTFGGQTPQMVGEDVAGDNPGGANTAPFGLDLMSVSIHQPDPDKPELVFIWKVSQLDREPPPEFVRYLWQMRLGGENGKEYWLQAKTSDFLSGSNIADDPPGHVSRLQGAFKLRGTCGPIVNEVPNVTTCRHVAWLSGVFDLQKDEIRVTMPLQQSYAPDFVPGAEISPWADGFADAGLQAVISPAQAGDRLSWDVPYTIPRKTVMLGIAPAGTNPSNVNFSTPATLGSGGGFSGSVGTAGLAPGSYDVWAKGCFAGNCGTRSFRLTI